MPSPVKPSGQLPQIVSLSSPKTHETPGKQERCGGHSIIDEKMLEIIQRVIHRMQYYAWENVQCAYYLGKSNHNHPILMGKHKIHFPNMILHFCKNMIMHSLAVRNL